MHLRDLARQAWADAGLYRTRDAKLAELLKKFDADQTVCVDAVESWLRGDYARYLETIVEPLAEARDPLMRVVLARRTNIKSKREVDLVRGFLKRADPVFDRPVLAAVKALGHKELAKEVDRIERAAAEAAKKAAREALNLAKAPAPRAAPPDTAKAASSKGRGAKTTTRSRASSGRNRRSGSPGG